jgi:hypothetical protein
MGSVTRGDVPPGLPARRDDGLTADAAQRQGSASGRPAARSNFRTVGVALVLAAGLLTGAVACTSSGSSSASTPATTAGGATAGSVATAATSAQSSGSAATPSSPASSTASSAASSESSVSSVPTSSVPAAPTTAVPAPGGGNVSHTVAAATPTTQSPVALSEAATIPHSLSATIQRVAATTVTAKGPGEISGPGLAVSVEVTNSSGANLSLDAISVTLTDSAGNPCSYVPVSEGRPFAGSLAPGKSATAVYVFTIPTDRRSPITVGLIYGPSTSVVLFTGTVR